MSKSLLTDQGLSLAERIQELAVKTHEELGGLEEKISSLIEKKRVLHTSVSVNDAADLISRSIRARISMARAELIKASGRALRLESHVTVTEFGGFDGNGEPEFSESKPELLDIVRDTMSPFKMLALVLTDAQIDAFARMAATEAGAVSGGRKVAELQKESEQLSKELEALLIHRKEAKAAIDSLSNVSLTPFISKKFHEMKKEAN